MLDILLSGGEALSTVFQPMFDISGCRYELWGVEALTRGPAGTHFELAPILFEYIRLKQEEAAADRRCIAAAVVARARLLSPSVPRLSLNVHACTLERDRAFPAYLESVARANGVDTRSLIMEIVEQSTYFDSTRFAAALADLRSLGIKISIDDLGLSHGNYRLILDAQPDYLKLDRYFVHGCANDRHRQALIQSAQQIAQQFEAVVIAEGVERSADLSVLRSMGIRLVQGFLLSYPGAPPSLEVDDSLLPLLSPVEHLQVERTLK
jgi:EAL domain-containing protein (putative c-di-GMP-specific phosphodiesterase class I)